MLQRARELEGLIDAPERLIGEPEVPQRPREIETVGDARILTELEYQRRLKAARTGNSDATDTQDGNGAPSVVPVVPPQVADNAEGNPSADKAEPAKASTGKGK